MSRFLHRAGAIATAAAIPVLGLTGAASASAATTHPDYAVKVLVDTTTLYLRNGGTLPLFSWDLVEVTCYYEGATADGYWDHVDWSSRWGADVGHVDDDYVNFDGLTPPEYGIPHC